MKRLFLICVLFCCMPLTALAAERYVAIGDSVAAGQTPYQQIDYSYADFIAQQLQMTGQLASYDRSLAFPGLTVEQVLASTQTEEAKALLSQATLITISAGANNLLPLIAHNAEKGTLQFSQLSANFALNKVRVGIEELLVTLRALAPEASIYVMGYYFPYTHVHAQQLPGVTKQLAAMNRILEEQALQQRAHFIAVEPAFASNRQAFLPNPADVHPNRLGHIAIANAFLASRSIPPVSEQQLPPPNPQSFEQLLQQRALTNEQTVSEHSQFWFERI